MKNTVMPDDALLPLIRAEREMRDAHDQLFKIANELVLRFGHKPGPRVNVSVSIFNDLRRGIESVQRAREGWKY